MNTRQCFQSHNELIDSLPISLRLQNKMKQVDRYYFCIKKQESYCDKPSLLFDGQTISAPHMHAQALKLLQSQLKPGNCVLDVGSGSGYLVACFSEMVNVYSPTKRGKVIGLEIHPRLVSYSLDVLEKHMPHLFTYPLACQIKHGSGWDGYPKKKYKQIYDAIHIGASCDEIPPMLFHQLKINGLMVLPLYFEGKGHIFCKVKKINKKQYTIHKYMNVRYVPLHK